MKYILVSFVAIALVFTSCKRKQYERKIDNKAWVCVEHQLTALGELDYDTTNIAFFKLYFDFDKEGNVEVFTRIDDDYDTSHYHSFINNSLVNGTVPVGEEVKFSLKYEFREDLPKVFRLDSVQLEIQLIDSDELWLRTYGATTATEYYKFEKIDKIP